MENLDTTKTEVTEETQGQEQETEKTYTQEEVDKLLQVEADRRVSAALNKQAKKNEEKMREAEKLAKMSADEKYQYELEQREKAIAEKENELQLAENKNVCAKILAEKGIPVEFVDFVVTSPDADTMHENITIIDKAFKKAVRAEVERRLASTNPKKSADEGAMTREQFNKLSMKEMMDLYNQDPDLFNSFN